MSEGSLVARTVDSSPHAVSPVCAQQRRGRRITFADEIADPLVRRPNRATAAAAFSACPARREGPKTPAETALRNFRKTSPQLFPKTTLAGLIAGEKPTSTRISRHFSYRGDRI
jgi:hypothetical protein